MTHRSASSWWIFYIDGDDWLAYPLGEEDVVDWWTCNQKSGKGDLGLIYAKAPVSSLVGVLSATSNARVMRQQFSVHDYVCSVECLRRFANPLTLAAMRANEPLHSHWNLIDRSFQSHFGKPPQIELVMVRILADIIPELRAIMKLVNNPKQLNLHL